MRVDFQTEGIYSYSIKKTIYSFCTGRRCDGVLVFYNKKVPNDGSEATGISPSGGEACR